MFRFLWFAAVVAALLFVAAALSSVATEPASSESTASGSQSLVGLGAAISGARPSSNSSSGTITITMTSSGCEPGELCPKR